MSQGDAPWQLPEDATAAPAGLLFSFPSISSFVPRRVLASFQPGGCPFHHQHICLASRIGLYGQWTLPEKRILLDKRINQEETIRIFRQLPDEPSPFHQLWLQKAELIRLPIVHCFSSRFPYFANARFPYFTQRSDTPTKKSLLFPRAIFMISFYASSALLCHSVDIHPAQVPADVDEAKGTTDEDNRYQGSITKRSIFMFKMVVLPRRHILAAALTGFVAAFSLNRPSAFASARPLPSPKAAKGVSGNAEGQWELTVTFEDGPNKGVSETAQVSIGQNNLFASTSTSDPTNFALAGAGTWEATGPQSFCYDFHEVSLSATGSILNIVHVHGLAHLNEDGSGFEAQGEGNIYGLDGHLLGTGRSSVQAVRIADAN